MRTQGQRGSIRLLAIAAWCLTGFASNAPACTGIRLVAGDGSVNRQVKMVDLGKIDWNARDIHTISMQDANVPLDVSGDAKVWNAEQD